MTLVFPTPSLLHPPVAHSVLASRLDAPALAQRSSARTAHYTATGSEFANILVLRPTPGQVLWYLWGWGSGISIFKAPPRKVWRAARTDSQLLVRTFRALGQRQTFHPRGAE